MNVFKDKTEMVSEVNSGYVRPLMTAQQCRDGTMQLINNRVYEAADVQHVERPKYGHHY